LISALLEDVLLPLEYGGAWWITVTRLFTRSDSYHSSSDTRVPKEIHEIVQRYGGETSCQISKSVGVNDGYLLEEEEEKGDLCTCSC